jgi:hypothetical protein
MMATKEEKEKEKDNKEFAAEELKNGTPIPQIALFLTLAAFLDVEVDAVKAAYTANTKLVQEAFRSL